MCQTCLVQSNVKGRDTRCDKSLRHIVCTDTATRPLALILWLRSVAQIQTGLNSCDRSQPQNSVAATMIFTCHTRRFVTATCRGDVSQRFVASSIFLSRPRHVDDAPVDRWPIMFVINLPQLLPVEYQTPLKPFYSTFAWLKSYESKYICLITRLD